MRTFMSLWMLLMIARRFEIGINDESKDEVLIGVKGFGESLHASVVYGDNVFWQARGYHTSSSG